MQIRLLINNVIFCKLYIIKCIIIENNFNPNKLYKLVYNINILLDSI